MLSNALLSDIRDFVEGLEDEDATEDTDWFTWAADLIRRAHKESNGVSDESGAMGETKDLSDTQSPDSGAPAPSLAFALRASLSESLAPLDRNLRRLSQQMDSLVAESKRPPASYTVQTRMSFPDYLKQVTTPKDLYEHVFPALRDLPQEHVVLVCLNTKGVPTHTEVVYKGTTNCAVYHPRDLFRIAALHNAVSIAVCHTHPSGDPTPSAEDIEMTKRVAEGGRLLDIPLLDHLILGKERYVAFSELHPDLLPKRFPDAPAFLKGTDAVAERGLSSDNVKDRSDEPRRKGARGKGARRRRERV